MLADPPSDPSQYLDPYELVFAYTPVEDPSIYQKAWRDFLLHLGKVTGKRVRFFPFQSNDAEIEAMRIGKLHIAGFNTGSVPKAVNCAGFHPFVMMAKEDGSYGYEMELITYPGSTIHSPKDIRGKTLAFTAPSSNSGYKVPVALLEEKFGMHKGVDYHYLFSGKHSNSIRNVARKIYQVAAVASSVRKRIQRRGEIQPDALRIIYRSDTFPSTGFGYVYNLSPDLVKKIKMAFRSFRWTGKDGRPSSLKQEFSRSGYSRFIPLHYKSDFEGIRRINQINQDQEQYLSH